MNSTKIGSLETFALILVPIMSHLLLNIPQTILNTCGTASLLNIIYISIIAILFCVLILKLMNPFPNYDLIDISEYLGGKPLKIIISIIFILYLLFVSSILLRNVCEALKIIYYFTSSLQFIVIFFIITPAIANIFGEKAIIKCNLIITPLIVIIFLISFASVSPLFVWQRIFPIFGYGLSNTFGFEGISNIFTHNELLLIMFLIPLLATPQKVKKVTLFGILASSLLLFLFVGTLLLSFPYVLSTESISPIYLTIVNTQFSTFFQRPEAIFIAIWILFFMSYLNIIILFSLKAFKKFTKIQNEKSMSYAISTLLFIGTFIPKSMTEIRFLENTVYKYLTIIVTIIIGISILILANIKYKFLKKKKKCATGGVKIA